MKKAVGIVLSLIVLVFSLTEAATTFHYNVRGEAVSMTYYEFSACQSKQVYVFAGTDISHFVKGKPVRSNSGWAYASVFNWCNNTYEMNASGPLNVNALSISGKSASIHADDQYLYDYVSGNWFPMDIHLSWRGNGDSRWRSGGTSNYDSPYGYHFRSVFNSQAQSASVSGSVTGLGQTMNFNGAKVGTIGRYHSGSVTIIHDGPVPHP